MNAVGVLACGAAGAFVGWFAGLFLCPDPGDIGIGAIPWAVGGAVLGATAGVTAGVLVLT